MRREKQQTVVCSRWSPRALRIFGAKIPRLGESARAARSRSGGGAAVPLRCDERLALGRRPDGPGRRGVRHLPRWRVL
eukprot:scaffold91_cov254-Pinguiococcus_pyrenoidosus.AAC.22